ncbi:MAG: hypothetical protein M1365_08725 [Actinobacteria bacterium]|nr:hypothetical protein [Actinomycetota bacterium]
MKNIELGRTIDYSKKVIKDTLDINAYRDAKQQYLDLYHSLYSPRKLRIGSEIDGGIAIMGTLLFPACTRLLRDTGRNEQDKKSSDLLVSAKVAGSVIADIGVDIAAASLTVSGYAVEGVGLKAGYNIAMAAGPDVLGAMKQAFKNFKTQPPSAAIV